MVRCCLLTHSRFLRQRQKMRFQYFCMALFTRSQKKTKSESNKAVAGARSIPKRDFSWVIQKPRITEKATLLSEKNIFAFEVSPRAASRDVYFAIRSLYGVVPVKVNMDKTPRTTKQSRRGGRMH